MFTKGFSSSNTILAAISRYPRIRVSGTKWISLCLSCLMLMISWPLFRTKTATKVRMKVGLLNIFTKSTTIYGSRSSVMRWLQALSRLHTIRCIGFLRQWSAITTTTYYLTLATKRQINSNISYPCLVLSNITILRRKFFRYTSIFLANLKLL